MHVGSTGLIMAPSLQLRSLLRTCGKGLEGASGEPWDVSSFLDTGMWLGLLRASRWTLQHLSIGSYY